MIELPSVKDEIICCSFTCFVETYGLVVEGVIPTFESHGSQVTDKCPWKQQVCFNSIC